MEKRIDIGSLVSIIWTEGVVTEEGETAPPVIGVVTDFAEHLGGFIGEGPERQKVELFSNGKRTWFERGDLRIVA